ncbi:aminotransferase class III-fold pyridoxal phosphate-dependent enzyme, partial [Sulfitobacter sp. HI0129]
NAYHGSSMGSGSLGGMAFMHEQGGMPIPGIHHINQPDWWSEGGDQSPEDFGLARAQELEAKILELGPEKVAAFIGEPVQGAGGVIVPPKTYWPEIQRICDKYDVLIIADEVICGFGRTGNWFGSQTMGIKPHIMTIAKGLSSGYAPIGGSIVCDEVAEVINACEFNHGYTYSGHPVCAAVALENLRIMQEENILDHINKVAAPALSRALDGLAEHPLVGGVNISGMMASLPLTPDKETRASFAADKGTVGYICREHCFANNLVMRHVGDRMIISPPLVITPEEIDIFAKRAKAALDATYTELQEKSLLSAAIPEHDTPSPLG